MSKREIKGGDKVRLKDGRIVKVNDIKNKQIVVTCVEYYDFSEVVEIVD